jgi:ComF family protein
MSLLSYVLDAILPATCACCGNVLVQGEHQVCVNCISKFDETSYSLVQDNMTELNLMLRIPFEAATSVFYYRKGGTIRNVVHAMKFHGNAELCVIMGRQMGLRLLHSGRFDDVDLFVPVPLHWWRRMRRGYNQSELLCRGMAEVMQRPIISDAIRRIRYTKKQSNQNSTRRQSNVDGAFRLVKPELLEGKHVLLVDDVLTTGATITACVDAIVGKVNNVKISVATLCKAQ